MTADWEQLGGWRVVRRTVAASTMDEVRTLLAQEAAPWAVVAGRQDAGRGRFGRAWQCPTGMGLLVSVATAVSDAEMPRAGLLSGAAGLAALAAIREATGAVASLKWPNDVVVGGRKLAGILVEVARDSIGATWAVTGIGINVNQHPEDLDPQIRDTAASLRMVTGRTWQPEELLGPLLLTLSETTQLWRTDQDALVHQWSTHEVTQGRQVWVTRGEDRQPAISLGVTATGALRVRWPSGDTEDLGSGEVSLRLRGGS
ncbi:MAG TPA: biotin--[acetyl-CoA-carboxylase] ligase [Armatimonadota bacterium]